MKTFKHNIFYFIAIGAIFLSTTFDLKWEIAICSAAILMLINKK